MSTFKYCKDKKQIKMVPPGVASNHPEFNWAHPGKFLVFTLFRCCTGRKSFGWAQPSWRRLYLFRQIFSRTTSDLITLCEI
jgi:hypothetical protein